MKEYLENIKIHHILIAVLVVLVGILYFDNRELRKMFYRQQFVIDSHYSDNRRRQHDFYDHDYFDIDINDKVLEIEREFRRLNRDFERLNNNFIKNFEKSEKEIINSKKKRNFVYNPQIKQDDKNFELILKLPRDIVKEDIKVDFVKNNLTINIEKNIKKDYSTFKTSFFESYYISETKATIKDVKIDFKDNTLNVVVPIIK